MASTVRWPQGIKTPGEARGFAGCQSIARRHWAAIPLRGPETVYSSGRHDSAGKKLAQLLAKSASAGKLLFLWETSPGMAKK
jgi:hypothetical protein